MDYSFYTIDYLGNSMPEQDFNRLALRAGALLNRYKRIYTITGTEKDKQMALCAMADTLYYYEGVQNGKIAQSTSVGSVSTSFATIDTSEKAQKKQLYSDICLYMKVCRGVIYG